jgi:hypothetical protein
MKFKQSEYSCSDFAFAEWCRLDIVIIDRTFRDTYWKEIGAERDGVAQFSVARSWWEPRSHSKVLQRADELINVRETLVDLRWRASSEDQRFRRLLSWPATLGESAPTVVP